MTAPASRPADTASRLAASASRMTAPASLLADTASRLADTASRMTAPAWRLAESKVPIAWLTGTNDQFYWLPAVAESYARAAGPKHLTLLPNYNHALTPAIGEITHLSGRVLTRNGSPLRNVTVEIWQCDGRAVYLAQGANGADPNFHSPQAEWRT